MVSKNKSKSMSRKRVSKKSQKGGVAYTFDHSCRVGGLPARVAISECPKAGPLDSCHVKQMYGQSCKQAGGKRNSKRSNKRVQKSKKNKTGNVAKKGVNKNKKTVRRNRGSSKKMILI
jgi:hypothetical protein